MNNNKKPITSLIMKIVGFAGISIVITALVLIFTGFGDFESNNFMIGGMLLPLGIIMTALGFAIGFKREIAKSHIETMRYVQQENKEALTDIANTTAEIMSGAVTTTAQAMNAGLQNTNYCIYCGAQIDASAIFCSRCGRKQQ